MRIIHFYRRRSVSTKNAKINEFENKYRAKKRKFTYFSHLLQQELEKVKKVS